MRTPIIYDDEGCEKELPFQWEICSGCQGHGKSSAYLGAFTADQMCEDPDFAADYMDGFYDRHCEECGGSGKVKVIDRKEASADDLAAYDRQEEDYAAMRATERQEYLFEGGWREEGWR